MTDKESMTVIDLLETDLGVPFWFSCIIVYQIKTKNH